MKNIHSLALRQRPVPYSIRSIAACNSVVRSERSFIGLGEIIGVVANPAETLRQLKESKEMLIKAREEAELRKERERIPKKHTFAPLPGFHGRKAEQELLRKILAGNPQLNVIFGATSVGKTALLREVLARDDFFVITFDLRISGFADLRSLYISLCQQFQRVFEEMEDKEMDKLAITFKHLVLDLDQREAANPEYKVTVAELADLMETLQSCLLRYWEYDPKAAREKEGEEEGDEKEVKKDKPPPERKVKVTPTGDTPTSVAEEQITAAEEEEDDGLFKKRPIVFLIDEAHKLPALINDQLCLKIFLDTLLVLTKQDRLCHVILSTSDSFFQHFLRSMNVGHHSQILTIGDCTKAETRQFFQDSIMPKVPDHLKSKVDFEEIYNAFGGKLSHISDYMSTWLNKSGEDMAPLTSPIFTQAYTLLQFHLTNEAFETYSPLSTSTTWANDDTDTQFSRDDLLYVMKKLVKPPYSFPYFDLCRIIGTRQADAMIQTRILDLRWAKTVSPEMDGVEGVWSKDGIERPIVLPMTRIVRRAMEIALQEEEGREKLKMDFQKDGLKATGK